MIYYVDMPDQPIVRQPNCTEISETSALFYVEWFAPNNRNNFDLGYYDIIITTGSMPSQRYLSLNTSLTFTVDRSIINNAADLEITVTAVSMCRDRSLSESNSFQIQCDSRQNSSSKLRSLTLWPMLCVVSTITIYSGFV